MNAEHVQLSARIQTRSSNLSFGLSDSQADASAAAILAPEVVFSTAVEDGGYGWVVVFSCSIICFFFVGTSYSWGVIQSRLVQDGLAPPATLAYVGSLVPACIAFFAIINAKIIRVLGARNTGFIGVSLLGLGSILAGWATESVPGLFVTIGLITGVGTSLCFMTSSTLPAQWFTTNRGLANGLVYAGGGLGGAIISVSMDQLLEKLGTAWTFRIIGIVTLGITLPAVWLIKEKPFRRSSSFIEWSLFRDPKFNVLLIAGAIATFPLFVPPFFLPLYSTSLGLSPRTGAGLVAGFNLSSAFGRAGFGYLGDKAGPINSLFITLTLSALSMLALWPISTSLGPLVALVVLNGVGNGGFFAVIPTVVGSVFGSALMTVAMGMVVTTWAGGYLMGSPIAGYLLEAYGGEQAGLQAYHPAIFYAGSLALGSAGLVAGFRFIVHPRLFVRV